MSAKTTITTYEVAAFTDDPAAGSPTGVVLDADDLSGDQMQFIARQLPFSHTAFVTETATDEVGIRFFTPAGEIKNCAHATIAAHYLRAAQRPDSGDYLINQRTLSGIQEVEGKRQGAAITVSFKQNEIGFSEVDPPTVAELLSVLNLPESALLTDTPVILATPGANRFLVEVKTLSALQSVTPDFAALKALCDRFAGIGCFAFVLESKSSPLQATARMFAPVIGVNEDTINGNGSGCLGAYLLRSANADKRELTLHVHQGHAFNRPGTVQVTARWVGDRIETIIGGTAVIVGQWEVLI